jgi:hypothetical protein
MSSKKKAKGLPPPTPEQAILAREIVLASLQLVEQGTFPGALAPQVVATHQWLSAMLTQLPSPEAAHEQEA